MIDKFKADLEQFMSKWGLPLSYENGLSVNFENDSVKVKVDISLMGFKNGRL